MLKRKRNNLLTPTKQKQTVRNTFAELTFYQKKLLSITEQVTKLSASLCLQIIEYVLFLEDNFGIMIHWGLYSVPAFDAVESAKRRNIGNGSEWYHKRLQTSETDFRPTSGYKETQRYHKNKYGAHHQYSEFMTDFTAKQFSADEWIKKFVSCNASYVVITAKHHDGFCLWPTNTTTFSTTHAACATNGHSDIVKSIQQACRKYHLKFGIYFSWMEFGKPNTKEFLLNIAKPQLLELMEYQPDFFWFDGDWVFKTKETQLVLDDCVKLIRKRLPLVQINDRIGHFAERKADPNYLGLSTYRVYEDRFIPVTKPTIAFESAHTIGLSWGVNHQQQEKDYKTASQLNNLRRRVLKLGGRFLLNVGPNADGTLDPIEVKRLEQMIL